MRRTKEESELTRTAILDAAERIFCEQGYAVARECPIFCVSVIWSMLSERSKDDDDFERTAGRTAEGLQAA